MTYCVDIKGPTLKDDYERLNKEFMRIHNQDFEQEVNITRHPDGTIHGEIQKMRHGINHYETYGLYDIPCHWDYSHMIQTQCDIENVALCLGIEIQTSISY